jgi:DNA-binding beta-propeller fold protein YncE
MVVSGRTVFVTGESPFSRALGVGYQTVAYRAATGKRLWASRYRGYEDQSLALNRRGTAVYVTGYGYGPAGFATVAYNAVTGKQLWAMGFGNANNYGAGAIASSPDGTKVFVTGSLDSGEYLTIAYRS